MMGATFVQILIFVSAVSVEGQSCPSGWKLFNNFCYLTPSYKVTWPEALDACKNLHSDSHLISIHDQEEQDYLHKKLRWQLWVGLYSVSKSWQWSDGTSMDFTEWRKGEPNNYGNQKCGQLYMVGSDYEHDFGEWITTSCEERKLFACGLNLAMCPSDWVPFNGMCYYFSDVADTWANSRSTCKKLHRNADLASIHSDDEHKFLVGNLYFRMWIGLNWDLIGRFEWSDRTAVDFTHWNDGQPVTDGTSNCVEVEWHSFWITQPCDLYRHFTCKLQPGEYYQPNVPEPTPAAPTPDLQPQLGFIDHPQENRCLPVIPKAGVATRCESARGRTIPCDQPIAPGSIVSYQCAEFYEPKGITISHSTCGSDGQWDTQNEIHCIPTCGVKNARKTISFVSNGEIPDRGEWPWHVALYNNAGGTWRYHCGGTLVSDRVVVTAAHCVTIPQQGSKTRDPASMRLGFGKMYIDIDENEEFVQYLEPEELIISPRYNWRILEPDIALVVLKEPVHITSHVRPACYPGVLGTSEVDFTTIHGKKGTILGWGLTDRGEVSQDLMEVEMPVVSHNTCIESFKDSVAVSRVTDTVYCAGKEDGKTVCPGDSGGGMVFRVMVNNKPRFVLQGIVSSGVSTVCDPDHYVFFTRVLRYRDFISIHVNA